MTTTITNYLFARSGFRTGMGRVLDLGGTFDSGDRAPNPKVADALALYSDWRAVGGDLAAGLDQAGLWEEEVQPWLIDPSEVK
jgi:hypothetical protein